MRVCVTRSGVLDRCQGGTPPKRWALKQLDSDKLMAYILSATWPVQEIQDVDGQVGWLGEIMEKACDYSMPRARPRPRRAAYWWTAEIAELRALAVQARRRLTRARRRGHVDGMEDMLGAYRDARKALSMAIRKAKAAAWDEQLSTLNRDPWGRPYKLVLKKMKPWTPPVTESLDPDALEGILSTLFPEMERAPEIDIRGPIVWREDYEVSSDEIAGCAKRLRIRGNKAPGPDGVPGRVLVTALALMSEPIARLFTQCLREGYFPPVWERANVVLIPKGGRPEGSPAAYRPICLLDEMGKVFERIIVNRLVQHLKEVGPDLHRDQFGFREGRSTTDAILRVRSLAESTTEEGGVLVAVSLDITNAFNTLPWGKVGDALMYHGVPSYLVGVTRSYFRHRSLGYRDKSGAQRSRTMYGGVPQGSVLGPLLWDIAYDRVLRTALPPGCSVVCYADDTLLLARGEDWGEAIWMANIAVARVVLSIRRMGLRVSPKKTEAIFIHNGLRGRPPAARIKVDDTPVQLSRSMRYLGLQLDGKWEFRDHIDRLVPKMDKVMSALTRILPNLGGPDDRVRKLYAHTVNAVALYASPVWADEAVATRYIRDALRRVQRRMAIRVVRGYRTVSHVAASVLAGLPPMELVARAHKRVYERIIELRGLGEPITDGVRGAVKLQARRQMLEEWREYLTSIPPTKSGERVVGSVGPVLEEWLSRPHESKLSFHLTQVLSGHGCFGEYLHTIRKESTSRCHHCSSTEDTAQHTLEHCPAWTDERRVLTDIIGEDLSLSTVVEQMVESEEKWKAVSSFCSQVMRQKEEAERERERRVAETDEEEEDRVGGTNAGRRRRRPPRRGQNFPPRPGDPRGGATTRNN